MFDNRKVRRLGYCHVCGRILRLYLILKIFQMELSKPFFDLCISDKCVNSSDFSSIAKKLLDLGYKTIAVSRFLNEETLDPRKKKKKSGDVRQTDLVPLPVSLDFIEGFEELKILHRLTIIFSDQSIIHKVMKSDNYKKYDIIAVLPTNQQAFQYACSQVEADIISFDPEIRTPIKFNRKMYNLAIDRGMFFEIMYAPAIHDSTLRKNIINMSHLYHTYGKSKNIIITSWATNQMMIRGPYDLVNLGLIFGLSESQSKNAIALTCKNLILRAEGRKLGKIILLVKTCEDVETMTIDDDSSEESDMDRELSDQPAQKKQKQ